MWEALQKGSIDTARLCPPRMVGVIGSVDTRDRGGEGTLPPGLVRSTSKPGRYTRTMNTRNSLRIHTSWDDRICAIPRQRNHGNFETTRTAAIQ
jgi:hypothetical protein